MIYKNAGVDRNFIQQELLHLQKSTPLSPQVLAGIGGFCSLLRLPTGLQNPVLASATDGVGTKFLLAKTAQDHEHIGMDVVAMCVNDLITCGATPLLFQDYIAFSQLHPETLRSVFTGIQTACQRCDIPLVGGETAQLPDVLKHEHYELSGTAVGVVEEHRILGKERVRAGDVCIGLASNGVHANGFSLIRQLLKEYRDPLPTFSELSLHEILLKPTALYASVVRELCAHTNIHALAHITGGGITENLPRVLPHECTYDLTMSWPQSVEFLWLQHALGLSPQEMLGIFNCGIGMIAIVPQNEAQKALSLLHTFNMNADVIGDVVLK